jgi:hypothetical protein
MSKRLTPLRASDRLSNDQAEHLVEQDRRALRCGARVSSFIDILAERRVRERLRLAATLDGVDGTSERLSAEAATEEELSR